MSDHMEAAVEAAAEALFEESQGLDQENDWGDDLPQEWREEWKYVAREIITAALPHIRAMIAAEAINHATRQAQKEATK